MADITGYKAVVRYRYTRKGQLEMQTEDVQTTQFSTVVAELEVTRESFGRGDEMEWAYDMNDDGRLDKLVCGQGRFISCDVELSSGRLYGVPVLCDRWGILSSTTDGYHDMVCNEDSILRWNGSGWD